eukprot:Nk52_evm14s223 gene=Nk52_evmTU14s223
MSKQGATLQSYNNELVKCIEDLKEKREILNKCIKKEEEEKAAVQNEIRMLSEKLSHINENLAKKMTARNEYDKTISETENAYMKILESSQTLLHVLKREKSSLDKSGHPSTSAL